MDSVFKTHANLEVDHWWFSARRNILRAIMAELSSPSRESCVVDVGCGTGANIAAINDDYLGIGVDASPVAIDLARTRFPEVKFVCCENLNSLNGVLEHANVFLLTDVLEHVRDDFQMLSTLVAAAKPGSYFLITVPADMSLWSQHDETHGHFRRYDMERFEMLWRDLPISPLLVSYFNSRLYPLIKFVRSVSRLRRKSFGEVGTDLRMPPRPLNSLLKRVFGGEKRRLLDALKQPRNGGYTHGVSLIAVLQRSPGTVRPHTKPSTVKPDHFDPEKHPAGSHH